jgi:hypothetical protein
MIFEQSAMADRLRADDADDIALGDDAGDFCPRLARFGDREHGRENPLRDHLLLVWAGSRNIACAHRPCRVIREERIRAGGVLTTERVDDSANRFLVLLGAALRGQRGCLPWLLVPRTWLRRSARLPYGGSSDRFNQSFTR